MLRILRVAGRRVALRLPSSSSTSSSSYSLGKVSNVCNPKWQSSSTIQSTRLLHITSARACQVRSVEVPQLAESISEGDIRFEKAVGDSVTVDEVIGEIETDKTSVAINSPVSGVIEELLVEDGSTVRPGQQVVRIRVSGEGQSAPAAPKASTSQTETKAKSETPVEPTSASTSTFTSAPAPPPTPSQPISTTNTATHAPIAQTSVESGSFGASNRTEQRVKINRMRARIAQRLKDAQNTYAMLTTFNEIDMTNAIEMRNLHKDAFAKRHNLKLGFMSAFVAASVHALKHMPTVNAVIDENEIIYRDYIDISVAVATPKGLVVPVLRNCENMNFAQIEQNIALLGEKARNNALAIEDMDGGTFTISNGGVFGSLMGTPIINPPQSAILGMHSIVERPVVVNKQIVIRPMMYVALTYDHRLIDGREAVTFLRKIKAVVEDPRVLQLDL